MKINISVIFSDIKYRANMHPCFGLFSATCPTAVCGKCFDCQNAVVYLCKFPKQYQHSYSLVSHLNSKYYQELELHFACRSVQLT